MNYNTDQNTSTQKTSDQKNTKQNKQIQNKQTHRPQKVVGLDSRYHSITNTLRYTQQGFFLLVGEPHSGSGHILEMLAHDCFDDAECLSLPDAHSYNSKLAIIKVGKDGEEIITDPITGPARSYDHHRPRVKNGMYHITPWTVRSLKKIITTSSLQGRRLIIIDHLHRLNESASNAFLKVLEEIPSTTCILASCHGLDTILPTIRSRAHIIPLPVPNCDDINDHCRSLTQTAPHHRIKRSSKEEQKEFLSQTRGSMIGLRYDAIYDCISNPDDDMTLITIITAIKNHHHSNNVLGLSKAFVTAPDYRRDHIYGYLVHNGSPHTIQSLIHTQKMIDANVSSEHSKIRLAHTLCTSSSTL